MVLRVLPEIILNPLGGGKPPPAHFLGQFLKMTSRRISAMKRTQQLAPRRSGGARKGWAALKSAHPPQLHPEIRISKIVRYQCSATGTYNIPASSLLNTFVIALTAVTTTRVFRSVRLAKVEVWGQPIALGASLQQAREIAGTGAGPDNASSDVPVGTEPAHLVWRPLPLAQNGLWQESGVGEATNLLSLTLQTGDIIDVSMEAVFSSLADAGSVAGPIPAAASPGEWYAVPLDGLAGSKLDPIDYQTLP